MLRTCTRRSVHMTDILTTWKFWNCPEITIIFGHPKVTIILDRAFELEFCKTVLENFWESFGVWKRCFILVQFWTKQPKNKFLRHCYHWQTKFQNSAANLASATQNSMAAILLSISNLNNLGQTRTTSDNLDQSRNRYRNSKIETRTTSTFRGQFSNLENPRFEQTRIKSSELTFEQFF